MAIGPSPMRGPKQCPTIKVAAPRCPSAYSGMRSLTSLGILLASVTGAGLAHHVPPSQAPLAAPRSDAVQTKLDELYTLMHQEHKAHKKSASPSPAGSPAVEVTPPGGAKLLGGTAHDSEEQRHHLMELRRALQNNLAHRGETPQVDGIDAALKRCQELKCKVIKYLKAQGLGENDRLHLNQIQAEVAEAEEELKKHALFPNGWPPKAAAKPSETEMARLKAEGDRLQEQIHKAEEELRKAQPQGGHEAAKQKLEKVEKDLAQYKASLKSPTAQAQVAEMESTAQEAMQKVGQQGAAPAATPSQPSLQPKPSKKGAEPTPEAQVAKDEQKLAQLEQKLDNELKEAGKIPDLRRIKDALQEATKADQAIKEILAQHPAKSEVHEKLKAHQSILEHSIKVLEKRAKELESAEHQHAHPSPAQEKALQANVQHIEEQIHEERQKLEHDKAKVEDEHEKFLKKPAESPEEAVEAIQAAKAFADGLVAVAPPEDKPKVQKVANALDAAAATLNKCEGTGDHPGSAKEEPKSKQTPHEGATLKKKHQPVLKELQEHHQQAGSQPSTEAKGKPSTSSPATAHAHEKDPKLRQEHEEGIKKLEQMVQEYRKMKAEFCKEHPENAACKAKAEAASLAAQRAEKLAKDLEDRPGATPEGKKLAAELHETAEKIKNKDATVQAEAPPTPPKYSEELSKRRDAIRTQKAKVEDLAKKLGLPPADQAEQNHLNDLASQLEGRPEELNPTVKKDLDELKAAVHPDKEHVHKLEAALKKYVEILQSKFLHQAELLDSLKIDVRDRAQREKILKMVKETLEKTDSPHRKHAIQTVDSIMGKQQK